MKESFYERFMGKKPKQNRVGWDKSEGGRRERICFLFISQSKIYLYKIIYSYLLISI